jgi:hypothetical protein
MSQVTRGSADFSWARKLTTDEWCAALAEGDYDGHVLPPNPPDAMQSRYVGSSGIDAYRHAAVFWQHVKSIMLSVDHPLDCSQSRVLDFGVGWGACTATCCASSTPTTSWAWTYCRRR